MKPENNSMNISVDQLLAKIGSQSVEIDLLRNQLNQSSEQLTERDAKIEHLVSIMDPKTLAKIAAPAEKKTK